MDSITKLRAQIDIINLDLCRLLVERKKLAEQIGNEKRKNGIEVYDRNREANIYTNLKQNFTPDEYTYLEPIFKQIISTSRQVQLNYSNKNN